MSCKYDVANGEHLEQSGGVGNIVPHFSLSSNAYFIFIDRGLRPRLFHALVTVHICNDELFKYDPNR